MKEKVSNNLPKGKDKLAKTIDKVIECRNKVADIKDGRVKLREFYNCEQSMWVEDN
jgi:hypothetical protein